MQVSAAHTREHLDRAIAAFAKLGEDYKVQIIRELPEGEEISIYRQGEWFDVCRGPHLPSTGKLGQGFKLMKLAGAYWRGDSKNKMLQRISSDKSVLKETIDSLQTSNRELQKAQNDVIRAEKLATVGRLTSGIAHEIGNPLAAVLGYAAILLKETDDPETAGYLQHSSIILDVMSVVSGDCPGAGEPGG